MNYDAGETIGWPSFTDSVAAVWRSLPPADRNRAVILTGNYGEAGSIARYGPDRGLPEAYSAHNSLADFGVPPEGADVVVAVGFGETYLRTRFEEVRLAGRVVLRVGSDPGGRPLDIDNDENGAPIWVCRGPRESWPALWEDLRHS